MNDGGILFTLYLAAIFAHLGFTWSCIVLPIPNVIRFINVTAQVWAWHILIQTYF